MAAAESKGEPTAEQESVWFEMGPPLDLYRQGLITDTGEETSNIVYARIEFTPSDQTGLESIPTEAMQVYWVTEVNGAISVLHLSREDTARRYLTLANDLALNKPGRRARGTFEGSKLTLRKQKAGLSFFADPTALRGPALITIA